MKTRLPSRFVHTAFAAAIVTLLSGGRALSNARCLKIAL
jgi:hypothetical protein